MPNPTIQFRLDPYQLARGLQAARYIDPTFQPVSANQMVKLIYLDWCAKMAINRSDVIQYETWVDLSRLLNPTKPTNPDTLANKILTGNPDRYADLLPGQPRSDLPKSEKSVVEDFNLTNLSFDDLPDQPESDEPNNQTN